MKFQRAEESVTKQQYYEQAILLTEALAHTLGALEIAIKTLDDNGYGNYPNTVEKLKEHSQKARVLCAEAMQKTKDHT